MLLPCFHQGETLLAFRIDARSVEDVQAAAQSREWLGGVGAGHSVRVRGFNPIDSKEYAQRVAAQVCVGGVRGRLFEVMAVGMSTVSHEDAMDAARVCESDTD